MIKDPSRFDAVITGGLGFIGSNLAIRLAEKGLNILLIDSLNPNYGGNMFNIRRYQEQKRGNMVVNISDIRDKHSLKTLLKDAEIIYNLAGQTSHMDSMKDPFTDLEINCSAQLSLLETCREIAPDVKIIYASTRQIYGRPRYLPVDETHPINPVDVNGINKRAGEGYHMLYSKLYNINSTCLRLTNTYGPRMRIKDARQTFLGIWISRIINKTQFEVWGGEQLRDYTYVDDCVNALIEAAEVREKDKIYNLGGYGEPITLKDTAMELIEAAREIGLELTSEPYIIREYPKDRKKIDIGDYFANDQLIKKETKWRPRISLREGFKRTLVYYQGYYRYYC